MLTANLLNNDASMTQSTTFFRCSGPVDLGHNQGDIQQYGWQIDCLTHWGWDHIHPCCRHFQIIFLKIVIFWSRFYWNLFLARSWVKFTLTHWGRVTHICVGKLTIISSDNGLWPGRRQAIIWTNAGILLISPLGTNFNEILIEIWIFSFKKMHLKVSFAK